MNYNNFITLKDKVLEYQPLNNYVKSEFQKDLVVFIGNRRREAIKQTDYPFICLYPIGEDFSYEIGGARKSISDVAVFYGLKSDDLEKANEQLLKIKDFLLTIVDANRTLNDTIFLMKNARLETDEGYFQPYFYARLLIQLEEIK